MADEVSKTVSENEPLFYKFGFTLFFIAWLIFANFIENGFVKDFLRIAFWLTFLNVLFFLPPRTTWLHSKFGKGITGFLIINLLGAAFILAVFFLLKITIFIFDFIPSEYNILIFVISFFVLFGFVSYWIAKSSKE